MMGTKGRRRRVEVNIFAMRFRDDVVAIVAAALEQRQHVL